MESSIQFEVFLSVCKRVLFLHWTELMVTGRQAGKIPEPRIQGEGWLRPTPHILADSGDVVGPLNLFPFQHPPLLLLFVVGGHWSGRWGHTPKNIIMRSDTLTANPVPWIRFPFCMFYMWSNTTWSNIYWTWVRTSRAIFNPPPTRTSNRGLLFSAEIETLQLCHNPTHYTRRLRIPLKLNHEYPPPERVCKFFGIGMEMSDNNIYKWSVLEYLDILSGSPFSHFSLTQFKVGED